MATVPSEPSESAVNTKTRIDQFSELPTEKKLGLMVAAAAIIAIIMGAWMWSQTPDYRVLYSNISDQDGGEIVITGTPEQVASYKNSWTGQYLAPVLAREV